MKSVLLRAPVLTNSGYGVHARQIARWLFDKEEELGLDLTVETLYWGNTGWITDVDAEDGLVGRILQASENKKEFYDLTIQLQLPNEWDPALGAVNIGITAGVETDRCNPKWVESVNAMNLVIVPSEFTRDSFLNSGKVETSIVVIPEAFIDEVKNPDEHKISLDLPNDKNFLIFGQITGNNPENDRKNLAYSLKWLAECLAERPDVGIIIKTNMMRNTKIDRLQTANTLADLIRQIKQGPGPNFTLLHGAMTNSEVVGLYTNPKVSALLSFTHGEGYGLPILEAAACGLPVIATGWSGHMEFMKHGKFSKVAYKLDKIHPTRVDNQIFVPEAQWAYPSEQDAKARVLKFLSAPELPRQWAKELKEKLLGLYNFETIASQYDNILLPFLR